MNLVINKDLTIPGDQFQFSYVRSGGPGGQNVNKVSSKVMLVWKPTEIGALNADALERLRQRYPSFWTKEGEFIVKSQLTRDQVKNKQDCLTKLRHIIAVVIVPPKKRIPTKPTLGSIRRRLENKARQSDKKRARSTKWGEGE